MTDRHTDKHRESYKEEAYELLNTLESGLLELEENPEDYELIGSIFRALHTIKGSGAMFGFDNIAQFTHEIETVFDKIRNKELKVTGELIDLTLKAKDIIKLMLEDACLDETSLRESTDKIKSTLKRLTHNGKSLPPLTTTLLTAEVSSHTNSENNTVYKIRFRPNQEIFLTGTNPLLILEELMGLGEGYVIAHIDKLPILDELNPENCYIYWDIILSTNKNINAIKDVFIFVEDISEIKIESIQIDHIEDSYKKLGEILLDRGDINIEDLQSILSEKKMIGELLVERNKVTHEKIESALLEQEVVRREKQKLLSKEETISTIKVPVEKLDKLVNLIGELVTLQARLSQIASSLDNSHISSVSEEVERITAELRDNTLNIRMLPIGTLFGRFKRLVRDLSNELRKEIELTTEGAETELDKTVLEKLNDPLIHIIRNSIDHGIEPPDLRENIGKPRKGRIHLSAVHSGANVLITITDDGAGLDKDKIIEKAIEKGLINPNNELSEKDIYNLIFLPGFSTAKNVTCVSGRGVGMDVVKKAIDTLRGSIDINTIKGKETSITIKLPLTLAIIDGLLVTVEERYFVLPLSIIEECVELTDADTKKAHGKCIANIRGEIIPYIRLRKEFFINGTRPSIEQIVITKVEDKKVGFVVDKVIGQHQTVIKNLGRLYKDVKGITGATVLGDGSIALILDAQQIIKTAEIGERSAINIE